MESEKTRNATNQARELRVEYKDRANCHHQERGKAVTYQALSERLALPTYAQALPLGLLDLTYVILSCISMPPRMLLLSRRRDRGNVAA